MSASPDRAGNGVTTSLDLRALTGWLDRTVAGGVAGELTARLVAGGRSNPTYALGDGEREWILRRPPHGLVLPTAHDMGREYRVLTALADTAVPVPATVGICRDADVIGAPFYVMERLDGVTLRTREDTAELSVPQRRALSEAMVTTLAALHDVDPVAVGLGDWGRPDGYLRRQLDRWHRQWEASATRDRPEVTDLLQRLGAAVPDSSPAGIVHGDFKIDNMMVDRADPTRILGVLDWEMSTRGDPLADLGILASFWDQQGEDFNPISAGATALPGFAARDEVVARYAELRGVDVASITWYMVFADVKIAVILEGINARHRQGQTVGEGFEGIGEMVGSLLRRAWQMAADSALPGLSGRV